MMIDFRKFRADRSRVLIMCATVLLSGQCLVLAADQAVAPQVGAGAASPAGNKQIAAIGIPKDAAVKDAVTAPGGKASVVPSSVPAATPAAAIRASSAATPTAAPTVTSTPASAATPAASPAPAGTSTAGTTAAGTTSAG